MTTTQHPKDTSILCEINLDLARHTRLQRGWSLRTLADHANTGLGGDAFQKYEAGRTRPTPRVATAWALALNLPLDQLVAETIRKPTRTRVPRPPVVVERVGGYRFPGYRFPGWLCRPVDPAGAPGEFARIRTRGAR